MKLADRTRMLAEKTRVKIEKDEQERKQREKKWAVKTNSLAYFIKNVISVAYDELIRSAGRQSSSLTDFLYLQKSIEFIVQYPAHVHFGKNELLFNTDCIIPELMLEQANYRSSQENLTDTEIALSLALKHKFKSLDVWCRQEGYKASYVVKFRNSTIFNAHIVISWK